MKILITNNALKTRSGSELYAKEVAEELLKRGHDVIVYSNIFGDLAKTMKKEGTRIVDDLKKIPSSWFPDIIHGQHHLETMTAIAYFPDSPVVYFCHGWRPWQEKPPIHPNILAYATVDLKTLKFMTENRVVKNKIKLLYNFVDLDRFKQRKRLPKKPKKALIFSNTVAENNYLSFVRQACERAKIHLDVVGLGVGQVEKKPELILKNYDIVFAFGRSALESLATGCSVIICGLWGVGPMTTLKEMKKLRDLNFGVAAIQSELNVDVLYQEICRYDAEDATLLSKELRKIVGIDSAIDKIERMYAEVFEKYKGIDLKEKERIRSLSIYLRSLSLFVKQKERELVEEVMKRDRQIIATREDKDLEIQALYEENKKLHGLLQQKGKEMEAALQKRDEEIRAMKFSKFWQAREFYIKINHLIRRNKKSYNKDG